MIRPLIVAAIVGMLPAVALSGQEPAAVAKVRSAPGFRAAAQGQFQAFESNLATHCATVAPDWAAATHRVYGQPQVAADGNLVNATWVESVPGTACGQSRTYRVLVLIRGGNARVVSLLPGDGYAGPQLQHDSMLTLAGAMATIVKGQKCPVDVVNTHNSGSEPTTTRQPWTEIWTVETCGKRYSVPMQFVPDETGPGTSIHIESKTIATLP